jgi:hypothetical protein
MLLSVLGVNVQVLPFDKGVITDAMVDSPTIVNLVNKGHLSVIPMHGSEAHAPVLLKTPAEVSSFSMDEIKINIKKGIEESSASIKALIDNVKKQMDTSKYDKELDAIKKSLKDLTDRITSIEKQQEAKKPEVVAAKSSPKEDDKAKKGAAIFAE